MAMMRLALLAAAASTASGATACCMAFPSCPSGYEQVPLHKCSLLDFFSRECTVERLCCSTIVCKKKAKETCRSNDDCDAGFACRFDQEQDPVSGNVKCLNTRSCVPRVNEGERCNGFTLPCMTQTCQEGLQCECVEATCDVPGYCRKPKTNAPAPASNACERHEDCATGFTCRFDQEVVNGNMKCLNTRSCVPRVGEGMRCNGYVLPCTTQTCEEGLQCECVEATCDIPGYCRKPKTNAPAPASNACGKDLPECATGLACRFDQEVVNGNVKCLNTMSCVPRVGEGEGCNGFTLPCMTRTCLEGLTCKCVEATCDAPGVCTKPTTL